MAVPNTNTFNLKDVTIEIYNDTNGGRNLLSCFADSDAAQFDQFYGSKTMNPKTLLGFRNYNGILPNGKFYNWAQVSDSRNMAPVGWHIASDSEWNTLINYVDNNQGPADSTGKALASTIGWNSSANSGSPGNIPELNNYSGFSAIPLGGVSSPYYGNDTPGSSARFFTSTANNSTTAWALSITYEYGFLGRDYYNKTSQFSVRCVRDSGNSNMYAYDYDGNYYTAVTIGTQTWLLQNLGCTRYRNGNLIT